METYFGLTVLLAILVLSESHDIKGFDDSVLFDINWPGDKTENLDLSGTEEHMIVTTAHHEKYKCILPNVKTKEENQPENYDGPMPFELLMPLFSQSSCSYRLESYWTYEICHGRFIRQYHEDREGKKVKLQEYYLGRWSKSYMHEMHAKYKTEYKDMMDSKKAYNVPVKKIDGINLPYFEIAMDNGTLCDLNNNKPRNTKLLYVCYLHGKHEVFSFKETSTCQYEIVVLSPLLCSHPKFKPQESGEHQIYCMPLEGSPNKPHSLLAMKVESMKRKSEMETQRVRVEFHPLEVEETTKAPVEKPVDTSPIESFLAGRNCLNGGTGWWKYEFCYGKSVQQYHIEMDGSKASINLGKFSRQKHVEWLAAHPHKRPKPPEQRTQLSHFYSDGTVCDKTGKPRQTEVKLKCLESTGGSGSGAVSLYLLEPRYCEYILGVESPLICDILQRADENGLVEMRTDNIAAESPVQDEEISLKIIKS